MQPPTIQLPKSHQELTTELAKIRRESMKASERGDFRAIARLTLEAARLNKALSEMLPKD